MYSRNGRPGDEGSDTDFGMTGYRLPPRYDGSRFRRDPPPERDGEPAPAPPDSPPEERGEKVRATERDGAARLLRRLGDRIGGEEALILSLILILSAGGGNDCESPGDVIFLLALLLLASR